MFTDHDFTDKFNNLYDLFLLESKNIESEYTNKKREALDTYTRTLENIKNQYETDLAILSDRYNTIKKVLNKIKETYNYTLIQLTHTSDTNIVSRLKYTLDSLPNIKNIWLFSTIYVTPVPQTLVKIKISKEVAALLLHNECDECDEYTFKVYDPLHMRAYVNNIPVFHYSKYCIAEAHDIIVIYYTSALPDVVGKFSTTSIFIKLSTLEHIIYEVDDEIKFIYYDNYIVSYSTNKLKDNNNISYYTIYNTPLQIKKVDIVFNLLKYIYFSTPIENILCFDLLSRSQLIDKPHYSTLTDKLQVKLMNPTEINIHSTDRFTYISLYNNILTLKRDRITARFICEPIKSVYINIRVPYDILLKYSLSAVIASKSIE